MGTIVCQTCEKTIDHFEDEKVTVLYGACCHCEKCQQEKGDMNQLKSVG